MAEVRERGPEQSKKPEGLLQRRITRRRFMRGAGTVALGAVAAVAVKEADKIGEFLGLGKEKERELTVLEKLREQIFSAALGPEELRQKLRAQVESLEKFDAVVTEIKTANEKFPEPDGTPTLIAQTKRKFFGKADPKVFWEGNYDSERQFLESLVPILRPIAIHRALLRDIGDLLKQAPKTLEEYRRFFDPAIAKSSVIYYYDHRIEVLNLPNHQKPQAGVVEILPGAPVVVPSAVQEFEEDKRHIQELLGNLPLPEDIKISLFSVTKYQNGADPKMRGGGKYGVKDGKPIISIDIDTVGREGVVHEIGHYFKDRASRFLTLEQRIEEAILEENILTDPLIGRDYPLLTGVLRQADTDPSTFIPRQDAIRMGLTKTRSFKELTGEYPNSIWLSQSRFKPLAGEGGIFGDFFDVGMIDHFSRQRPPESFSTSVYYEEFVEMEDARLEQWAKSGSLERLIVDFIKEKPKRFNSVQANRMMGYTSGSMVGELPEPRNYASHWRSVLTFGQAFLLQEYYLGNPVVIKAISEAPAAKRANFLEMYIKLMDNSDDEKLAEVWKQWMQELAYPEFLPVGSNSFQEYLNKLRVFLKPAA